MCVSMQMGSDGIVPNNKITVIINIGVEQCATF